VVTNGLNKVTIFFSPYLFYFFGRLQDRLQAKLQMVGWSPSLSNAGFNYRTLWFSSSSNPDPNTHSNTNSNPNPASGSAASGEQTNSKNEQGQDEKSDSIDSMGEPELRSEVGKLRDLLKEETKKGEDMKEKLVRTLADMENLRERTSRQVSEARQFAVQGLVKSLVDVADNLERAAGSVSIGDVDGSNEIDLDRALSLLKSLREGVVLTDNILMKVLESQGVKRYDPLGNPFDPNLHNALFEVPDATKEPGTVALVIKKGYMLHDRAVRAAEVGVVAATNDDPGKDEPGSP